MPTATTTSTMTPTMVSSSQECFFILILYFFLVFVFSYLNYHHDDCDDGPNHTIDNTKYCQCHQRVETATAAAGTLAGDTSRAAGAGMFFIYFILYQTLFYCTYRF
jgi:hypothetical protein